MRRTASVWMVSTVLAASLVAVSGCGPTSGVAKPTPKVKPPAIAKAGVLRAAIDLSIPPFGGSDKGVKAGLDIDVASAVAQELGLTLQIVDAKPDAGTKMLRDHKADIMLAGMSIDSAVQAGVAFAGSYVNDAPSAFSTSATTVTLDSLSGNSIAVQKDSLAYWLLVEDYGEASLSVFPTLREAMAAADSGAADFAAGDGLVGGYMLRDFARLRFNGQIAPATPLGVMVGKDDPDLETAVRAALDRLSGEGILENLRMKWVGTLPRFKGSTDASGTSESSSTSEPSTTP